MNILTFDIEDWFHLLDNKSTKTINEWGKYEIRINSNMEHILSLLEKHNKKATFFCLGWIAEKYPEVIRQVVDCGYELGSHSRMHQLVYEQTPYEFKKDIEHSIKTIEDISGKKVKYYRAPGFSIKEDNKWALKILTELGIEVDSSIFPLTRGHGGFPSFPSAVPSIIQHDDIKLKEFPINYSTFCGHSFTFSGGGYFRFYPYQFIKHFTKKSDYVMSYFHPRDFDFNQPMIKELPLFRKFKSYVGLKGSSNKLEQWLIDFEFIDIETAVKSINWNEVPTVKIL